MSCASQTLIKGKWGKEKDLKYFFSFFSKLNECCFTMSVNWVADEAVMILICRGEWQSFCTCCDCHVAGKLFRSEWNFATIKQTNKQDFSQIGHKTLWGPTPQTESTFHLCCHLKNKIPHPLLKLITVDIWNLDVKALFAVRLRNSCNEPEIQT